VAAPAAAKAEAAELEFEVFLVAAVAADPSDSGLDDVRSHLRQRATRRLWDTDGLIDDDACDDGEDDDEGDDGKFSDSRKALGLRKGSAWALEEDREAGSAAAAGEGGRSDREGGRSDREGGRSDREGVRSDRGGGLRGGGGGGRLAGAKPYDTVTSDLDDDEWAEECVREKVFEFVHQEVRGGGGVADQSEDRSAFLKVALRFTFVWALDLRSVKV
jgi:hypothetical protein